METDVAASLVNFGQVYEGIANYPDATNVYLQALRICEKYNHQNEMVAQKVNFSQST